MLKYVIGSGVVQYATETWQQAMRRHERMVAHNARVDRELARRRTFDQTAGRLAAGIASRRLCEVIPFPVRRSR